MPDNDSEKSQKLTRREFLKDTGLVVGGVTVGSLTLLAACNEPPAAQTTTSSVTSTVTQTTILTSTATTTQTAPPVTVTVIPGAPKLTVLNPCGFPPPLTQKAMTPRPASLDGRKVYLVDVTFDNGDLFLDQMKDWFAQNMPQATVIRRTKKGVYSADDPDLWKEIQAAQGVMVMAIGH